MVVVVEVKRGEGNGTTNPMVNHTFDSYAQAKNYAKERFGVSKDEVLKELTEMPFLTELMGFRSATLFVDPHYNSFPPHIPKWLNCSGNDKLNAMAIYLGCAVSHGLSLHLNASGDAFFIGTTSANQPVTSNVLWGAASLVSQAMAYYPDEYLEKPRAKAFRKWSHEYARGTWKPNAEDDSINLYQTDPFQCDWESVDHRIAST
ncbi:hypothetical protein PHYBOEH_006843 [Phytophthora boehmeriae]|uniref:Uncharacterized protein n=1 Tax=Phytophthora boehmeriae TaxID=109152 RepID=A0A8T1X2J7_9STRA|nr:hypothetical protein PHYBOEH_006843 [Phytophthora boehmeriae]